MAQKLVRTLHNRLKIIEQIEKNPGEKRVDIAKQLWLPASTLNTIFAKKNEICEQIRNGNRLLLLFCCCCCCYYYYYFGQDWEELCGAQKYDFQNHVSVDRDVATSGVSTVEELCEAYGSTISVEEKNKEDEKEQDMVPSFTETYKALEKVKAFFYAHSVTDVYREHILGLEKSYFQLRQNSAKKQKTMYDFFYEKKWFSGFLISPHSSIVFPTPLKNGRSREHCT
jgi:hypothetical protein